MRYLSMLLVITVVFVIAISFATPAAATPLAARAVDPLAADTLSRAIEQSAIIRSLIATLEHSNVIVHIESSRSLPSGISGTTQFVTSGGGYRYLRIAISAELSRAARRIILGHELQHACEVARSDAVDGDSMRALFHRVGYRHGDFYETRAALDIERRLREEQASRLTFTDQSRN